MLADKAAALLFWYALGAAVLTAIAWSIWGTPESAVTRTITVLVIACPHALGLAIPLVVSIATERAARAGILITDRMALEAMRNVDTVLFDKTGTLTKGEPAVVGVRGVDGYSDDDVLSAAAAVEFDSEHPLGRAVVAAARELSLEFTAGSDFQAHNGIGVAADVAGARVGVGGPGMLRSVGATAIPGTEEWLSDGSTVLHVVRDEKVIGALALADEIRPESALAVDASMLAVCGWPWSPETRRPWPIRWLAGSGSTKFSPKCFRRTRERRYLGFRLRATAWRWSVTGSTMRRHSPRRMWASRSVPEPTWRSRRRELFWPAMIRVR